MFLDDTKDNYQKELISFSIKKATRIAISLLVILCVAIGLPFVFLHIDKFSAYFSNFNVLIFLKDLLLFFLISLVGIALHELIHGLTWAMFIKERFRVIQFGVLWKYLTPYCHCKVPMKLKYYLLGAIMPALILGIFPLIIAFINGNILIFLLGIYFTVAASGDFLIVYYLRNERCNDYVKDHESMVGCTVYRLKKDK
ncbi:MAG: DUF3267 domain-containing protein [Dysgonamonadaceae bacterium]|jgi:hypothetical protein|nr:DUF3267 domain-containing protein [Dysgonamonadaceae bacterium]MDD3356999.1 DUF3267 domain-containing protein [Dysgonamonadaceae bacterium]MDD3727901.1 DUF3267 domain-containing protein [Dysgonamonadaceae bacterium]MDD4246154.1 DUF3267 domain-containing protein [Dysgonamonadaceae bacterium]MDD4605116.1 DUF3267 domain-containing protein [Dysgonamonadaceae bacterium]